MSPSKTIHLGPVPDIVAKSRMITEKSPAKQREPSNYKKNKIGDSNNDR